MNLLQWRIKVLQITQLPVDYWLLLDSSTTSCLVDIVHHRLTNRFALVLNLAILISLGNFRRHLRPRPSNRRHNALIRVVIVYRVALAKALNGHLCSLLNIFS